MISPTYLSVAETAKFVRRALKREFPGVKFSVRSDSYSGGASIDVKWTDGPTRRDVERVAKAYAGATFDGMIDLKSYHSSELYVADDPARDGEAVHFGADFVFCERSYSEAFARQVRDDLARHWSREPGDFPEVREGSADWCLDWDHPSNFGRNAGPGGCDPGYLFQRACEGEDT
jgi:hypothetical protein